jgi:hypothetical protein
MIATDGGNGGTLRGIPLAQRFELQHTPVPESGCWLWIGATNAQGYGRIKVGSTPSRAHRVAWAMHYGAIPAGMDVLHKCDTPSCVNPDHLFLGGDAENAMDRERKGRGVRLFGERHGRSKISDKEADAIRADSRSHREIGFAYGISHTQVGHIKCGKSRIQQGETK